VSHRASAAGARAAALGVVLVAGVLPPSAVPAAAHAIVLESVPAPGAILARPPERVSLRFNSKVEKRLARVTLAKSDGAPRLVPIASDASDGSGSDQEPDRIVIPLPPLPPGLYVIRYRILSADGHVTEGALRFTVGSTQ
jgi:copper resistance protein C